MPCSKIVLHSTDVTVDVGEGYRQDIEFPILLIAVAAVILIIALRR